MKAVSRITSIFAMLLTLGFAVRPLQAQCEKLGGFAKKACETGATNGGSVGSAAVTGALDKFKGEPLSTNFSDTIHLDTLPPEMQPKAFRRLTSLARTDDGAFLLKVGIYEATVQSFSLDAGAPSAPRVAGYYPAPIKGRRAKAIADVLKQIELHPDVPQSGVQQLLWAIVNGTDLEKMPPTVQQTAAKILPKDMLVSFEGRAIANAFEKTILGEINNRIKKLPGLNGVGGGSQPTALPPAVAETRPDAGALPEGGLVLRGTWAQMPGGFYVRYLPEGYAKTRLQVIVPDAAIAEADPKTPLAFDPTQYLAVYCQAPPQRLGISLRPAR